MGRKMERKRSIITFILGYIFMFPHADALSEIRRSYECALWWGGKEAVPLVEAVYLESKRKDDEVFMTMTHAVITAESLWEPGAISPAGARGLMQLTRPAVVDAARHCGLDEDISPDKLYNPHINIRYGTCYLDMLRLRLRTWSEVLIVYNGGYRALTSWRKSGKLNSETGGYVSRVLSMYELCRGI